MFLCWPCGKWLFRRRKQMHRSFASLRMTEAWRPEISKCTADRSSGPRLPAPTFYSAAIPHTPLPDQTSCRAPRSSHSARPAILIAPEPLAFLRTRLASSRADRETQNRRRAPPPPIARKAFPASAFTIWNLSAIPNDFKFSAINSAARLDDSTKYTMRAPRLRASMPTAPVPAYKSSHVDPASAAGSPAHNTLKSVSRSRSAVGRISRPGKDSNVRRRYWPAITRIGSSLIVSVFLPAQPFRFAFSHLRGVNRCLS